MSKIKDVQKTTKSLIENIKPDYQPSRGYLGMSGIGHGCSRYLWYTFRWAYSEEKLPARVHRLFNRGHREEPVIYALLKQIGYKVYGDQTEVKTAYGHVLGHCDGMVEGVIEAPKTTHLLEIKTMSDKKFKELQRKGLEKANPVYWAQIQLYMRYLKLTRCLYIVVNKNDDDLWIDRIYYNAGQAKEYGLKALDIVNAPFPPIRAFPSKTYFECKWCPANKICWEDKPVQKNCRTCIHVLPIEGGQWHCRLHDAEPPVEFQRIGCDSYQAIDN